MGIKLFPHNEEAYRSALSMLAKIGKAAVIYPTGTGKSFIGFKFCEDFPERRICWLSPSEYIFQTQLENLRNAADGWEPENVTFFTYAKLMWMSEEEFVSLKPDLIILDEFHRCGAEQWGVGVQRLLACYPKAGLLGLSATAIRYLDNRRDMAEELFDRNIASEITLGEAIVRGILHPPKYILSVFSYQKDLEKYERRLRQAKSQTVREAGEKYLEALRRALEKAVGMEEIFDRHMVERTGKYLVFCANKAHMDEMIALAGEWFARVDAELHIYSVYTGDPMASEAFQKFKEDESKHLRLLYCIDALNEGIHMDNISGVILLRPTISPIIYKQQIGRALSAGKKKEALIFDIVLNIENLSSIGGIEEEMASAAAYYRSIGSEKEIIHEHFQVWEEVKDCRALFEKLNETLGASWERMYDYAKEYYETHGNLALSSRYRTKDGYSLGNWVFVQRNVRQGLVAGRLSDEQIRRLDAIGMIWETVRDLSWSRYYEAARTYYKEKGDLNVPSRYVTEEGIALGQWLCQLRNWERSGVQSKYLSEDRKRKLEKIGMIWDKLDYLWERNYFEAYTYYQEHHDLNVPSTYVTENGICLGAWLCRLRQLRAGHGRGTPPTVEQIRRLDAIGMIWEKKTDSKWEAFYQAAEKYAEEKRTLLVPVAYTTSSGLHLGTWIQRQRKLYREGKLSQERKAKLDSIGMAWETEDPWKMRFEVVRRYYKEHGTLTIPQNLIIDGIWAGKWIAQQKKWYENGEKLTEEQRKLLEELPLEKVGRLNKKRQVG